MLTCTVLPLRVDAGLRLRLASTYGSVFVGELEDT